jgi:trehalose utilization protein
MAPHAQTMVCRTKTSLGSPLPDTVAENTVMNAMQFCVAPPLSPTHHAQLLTMSLGWLHSWTPRRALWRDCVTNVAAAGLPYFIANGNEGSSSPPDNVRTPGDCPNPYHHPAEPDGGRSGAISIGATTSSDDIASFSSWGPVSWTGIDPYNDYAYPPGLYKPDFSAPGENVTSCRLGGGYTQMSGTSMATPCAAGVCALILEKNPNLLPEDVSEIMQNSVLPLGTQPKNNTFGTGRIDAMLCIANTPAPGPFHDVALDRILAPAPKIDPLTPLAPVVVVRNRGTFPEPNVAVHCRVDSLGTAIYNQTSTITLLDSAGVDTVTFPNWNVGPGSQTYDLWFWHSYVPDTNHRNDTLRRQTITRGHDVAMSGMNVGSRVRANQPFVPSGSIQNLGDYTESGFNATCMIESAGVQIYTQTVPVDSVPIGATTTAAFPTWNVGPDSTTYVLTMYHDCGPDQNRRNDTLSRSTMASANVLRVAIEIAIGSNGRTPPNACYRIDSLCDAQGWTDSIVVGTDIDDVSKLADYDVVITGDVGYNDNDFLTYQSALLQWVRQGGGFVGCGWIVFGIANQSARMMDSALAVNCISHYGFLTSGQVRIIDNTHPITQGVSDFPIQSHGEYAQAGLWPNAVMLGDYTDAQGRASIAYKQEGAGRSVYLGPIFFATFGGYGNEPYYDDENAMRLMKQAIEWAAWGATGIETPREVTPARAGLEDVRPNPAGGAVATTIGYSLPRTARVTLGVYDLAGQLVRTLLSGVQQPGTQRVVWNRRDNSGRSVASGVYFIRLESEGSMATRKLVVR